MPTESASADALPASFTKYSIHRFDLIEYRPINECILNRSDYEGSSNEDHSLEICSFCRERTPRSLINAVCCSPETAHLRSAMLKIGEE